MCRVFCTLAGDTADGRAEVGVSTSAPICSQHISIINHPTNDKIAYRRQAISAQA